MAEVVEPNELDSLVGAARARQLFPHHVVVNPSHLHVSERTQPDYRRFWDEPVRRFAVRVVVAPGWNFSRGARKEISLAVRLGLPLLDLEGAQITTAALKEAEVEATTVLRAHGWTERQIAANLPTQPPTDPDREVGAPANAIVERAASAVLAWVRGESASQLHKFGTKLYDEHTSEGLHEGGWWHNRLLTYLYRAELLGPESLAGRQALGKFVATGCGLPESILPVYGRIPLPGAPSRSNIQEDEPMWQLDNAADAAS